MGDFEANKAVVRKACDAWRKSTHDQQRWNEDDAHKADGGLDFVLQAAEEMFASHREGFPKGTFMEEPDYVVNLTAEETLRNEDETLHIPIDVDDEGPIMPDDAFPVFASQVREDRIRVERGNSEAPPFSGAHPDFLSCVVTCPVKAVQLPLDEGEAGSRESRSDDLEYWKFLASKTVDELMGTLDSRVDPTSVAVESSYSAARAELMDDGKPRKKKPRKKKKKKPRKNEKEPSNGTSWRLW